MANITTTNSASGSVFSPLFGSNYTVADITVASIAATIFAIYNVYFLIEATSRPERTVLGRSIRWRRKWLPNSNSDVKNLIEVEGGRILAIQNLRNGYMAASFFGTASITIAFFAINNVLNNRNTFSSLLSAQIFVFATVLIIGFMAWIVVIRKMSRLHKARRLVNVYDFRVAFHNAGYNISGEPHPKDEILTPKQRIERDENIVYTRSLLISGTIAFNIGVRSFYAAICIAAWAVHSIALLITTVLMVAFMYVSDHPLGSAFLGSCGKKKSHVNDV